MRGSLREYHRSGRPRIASIRLFRGLLDYFGGGAAPLASPPLGGVDSEGCGDVPLGGGAPEDDGITAGFTAEGPVADDPPPLITSTF
jgi:hypothetical protein